LFLFSKKQFLNSFNHFFISKDKPVNIFRIKNKASETFLDSKKVNNSDDFELFLDGSGDSTGKLWEVERVGESVYYRFKNRISGFYLGSNLAGKVLFVELNKNDPFQEWEFRKDTDEVVNRGNGLHLTLKSKTGSLVVDSPIQDENADAALSQKWDLIPYDIDPFKKQKTVLDILRRGILIS
jgi:hypothetical protein